MTNTNSDLIGRPRMSWENGSSDVHDRLDAELFAVSLGLDSFAFERWDWRREQWITIQEVTL